MRYPHDTQIKWFRYLINKGKDTEWGRNSHYESINTIEEYRNRVPVNEYSGIQPYIDRMMKGEQKLLWPEKIRWFAKSSGTTSDKSKYIPVSKESLSQCHFEGGRDLLSVYCHLYPDTKMFTGKSLAMGGSHKITKLHHYKYSVGDLSAVLIKNLPFWAEYVRIPKRKIALHHKWEEKIEEMANSGITHKITSLSGVPSWTLLLLKRVLEKTGKANINEVWPGLEVFFHGGVNFNPYREQYKQIIPSANMRYMETYNASEGFFAIQDQRDCQDLLLMLDYGIYYEFLPLDQLNHDKPRTLTLNEVKTETNYALIISTNGGLWRYLIGDTIKFTSLTPYRIRITGRTRNFINAFGVALIIENAENALAIACKKTNAIIAEYTAAPVFFSEKENAAHEWVIEFEKEPDNIDLFTKELDKALQAINTDYEAKRYKNMILREPIIHLAPVNTFYNWMKERGKLGGQNKVPRLANERKYIDEVLGLL
jgi:hypothetical protein